jgi:hypothetical protein
MNTQKGTIRMHFSWHAALKITLEVLERTKEPEAKAEAHKTLDQMADVAEVLNLHAHKSSPTPDELEKINSIDLGGMAKATHYVTVIGGHDQYLCGAKEVREAMTAWLNEGKTVIITKLK